MDLWLLGDSQTHHWRLYLAWYIIAALLVLFFFFFLETHWLLVLICAPQVWDMTKLGQQAGSCKSKIIFIYLHVNAAVSGEVLAKKYLKSLWIWLRNSNMLIYNSVWLKYSKFIQILLQNSAVFSYFAGWKWFYFKWTCCGAKWWEDILYIVSGSLRTSLFSHL